MVTKRAVGFEVVKKLESWINQQPEETRQQVAVALASRAALRALPLLAGGRNPLFVDRYAATWTTLTLRANIISRVASKHPTLGIKSAAHAYASARSAESSASYAADSAANSVDDSAYSAARAIFASIDVSTNSHQAMWEAATGDIKLIEGGIGPSILRGTSLWPTMPPKWWRKALKDFEKLLHQLDDLVPEAGNTNNWLIWLEWYKSIAVGKPSFNLPIDIAETLDARIALGDYRKDFWDREPYLINAEIASWLKEAKVSAAFAQDQSSGLQFQLRDRLIGLARGLGLSSSSGDQDRIQKQLPLLIDLVTKLESRIKASELPRDGLLWAIINLKETVTRDTAAIGAIELFSATAILRHQLEVAKNPILGSNVFALDGPDLAWSQSVALISDMIVLATVEGRKLFDDSDRVETDAGELDHYRKLEIELLDVIADQGNIMEPEAIELLKQVILIGNLSPIRKRTNYLSQSSMRNAMFVVSAVGVVGAVGYALIAAPTVLVAGGILTFVGKTFFGEGLKKSKPGEIINSAITNTVNETTARFVLANRMKLREVAGNRPSYQWLRDLLDWVDEQEKKKPPI